MIFPPLFTYSATPGGAVPTRQPGENGGFQCDTKAAAQIQREAVLDGYRAKIERENDGKNGEHHKKYCDRAPVTACEHWNPQ
jgi:hypothetical protein